MRNLKRTLSLVLAALMLIGMMVVSAGAVGINDFTDKDEIVNKDAVGMLTTLGIIDGKPDGTYAPNEGVDRAQMAKMISVIMNQGVDNSTLYENVVTGLTDVNNSWAKGHINYCYTTGIIAGRGDNTFDPDHGVTALEAAKMLLVAAGYDPEIEGFTGANWAINVSAKADAVGIFRNFTKDLTKELNRDDAALLIYNALDIEMIQKYENGYPIAYADSRTILSTKYGVIKVEGVVTANEWAVLDDDSDTALKEGLTRIENANGIFSTTSNTTVPEQGNVTSGTFKVSTPVEMLGHTVTMYIKKTTILANSVVYGTPVLAENNSVTVGTGDLTGTLKDAKLITDKNTEYYQNYAEVASKDFTPVKGASLTVVDNNNDGIVDYVIQVQKTLTEISTYNEKNDVITAKGVASKEFANVVGAADVAKDDVVLAVTYGGRLYVEKPDMFTGQMTSFNTKVETERYMVVDGENYYEDALKVASGVTPIKFLVTECNKTNADGVDGVMFDATYNFYKDNFGYVVAFEKVESAPANYALITDSAWTKNSLKYSGEVKMLTPDGKEAVYTVDWDNTLISLYDEVNNTNSTKLANFLGSDDVVTLPDGTNNGTKAGSAKGILVTYTLNEDGSVVLSRPELGLSGKAYAAATSDKEAVPFTSTLIDESDSTVNFNTNAATLDSAIDAGDTKFTLNDNSANYVYKNGKYWDAVDIGTANDSNPSTLLNYGIDSETVIYYYDATSGNYNVVTGYDNLYTTTGTTTVDAVFYNPVKDGTKVAEVLVLRGTYKAPDNSKYALVTDTWDTFSGYKMYSAVLEDGSIVDLKSKQDLNKDLDGVNNMVYKYTTNDKGETTFTSVFDATAQDNAYYVYDGTTDYVADVKSGYNVTFGYVHVPYANWVETYHASGASTEWDQMLADKNADVIYNIYDLDSDATKADTVSFKDGQQAVIVYSNTNGNYAVKCAWVIADVDDDIVAQTPASEDMIVEFSADETEILVYNPNNAGNLEVRKAVLALLAQKGFTDSTYDYNASFTPGTDNKIADVTAKDAGGAVAIDVMDAAPVYYNGTYLSLAKAGGTVTFNVSDDVKAATPSAVIIDKADKIDTGMASEVAYTPAGSKTATFTMPGGSAAAKTELVDAYQLATGVVNTALSGSATFAVDLNNTTTPTALGSTTVTPGTTYVAAGATVYMMADAANHSYISNSVRLSVVTATSASQAGIWSFTMPSNTVAANTFTRVATLSVGAQNGTMSGSSTPAESVSYTLTCTGLDESSAQAVTVTWYTDNTYTVTGSAPTNLATVAANVTITGGTATLTLAEDSGMNISANTYYFTITVDGITSGHCTLVVGA